MRKYCIAFLAGLLICTSCSNPQKDGRNEAESDVRIVSLNSAITETLFALGLGEQVIAVDITSTYPSATASIQKLGHVKSITAEPIISLKPSVVILQKGELSTNVTEQLKSSNIRLVEIEREYTPEGCKKLIADVANSTGQTKFGMDLQRKFDTEWMSLNDTVLSQKVLFIYARGGGNLMVSGKDTPVSKLIELSGAQNAIESFEEYRPLNAEVLLDINPDIILMFEKGFSSIGGMEGLARIPGLSETDALRSAKVVTMDGQLISSFGPRTIGAALSLREKIIRLN